LINSTGIRKNLKPNNDRRPVRPYLREIFPEVGLERKIAARVGVSDRTLEKIRVIREASLQNPTKYGELWDKVGEGKMKIDKGYNQIKKFQRIKEAE
jgi:hypothetical protein